MKHCPNPECSHLEETGRAGEYREDIERCSDCGTDLAPGEPPEIDRPGQLRWEGIVEVPDPHAAHLVKSALAMEGIPSELRPLGKGGGSIVPGQAVKAEVIVPDHLADAAREVLSARSGTPVALPEGEDLEFVDVDGNPLESLEDDGLPAEEMEEFANATDEPALRPDAAAPARGAPDSAYPAACPGCSSTGVTSIPPEDPSASRGFFKRVFKSRARWICLACQHRW
jgi:hypothetical protein